MDAGVLWRSAGGPTRYEAAAPKGCSFLWTMVQTHDHLDMEEKLCEMLDL